MSQTLEAIAEQRNASGKEVQRIYAFNGNGKTQLSRKFKELVAPKASEEAGPPGGNIGGAVRPKILYYNAFTEDLFYWDNQWGGTDTPRLLIQPNSFTNWILNDQGQDQNVIANFQHYTSDKLTPKFNPAYPKKNQEGKGITVPACSEVTFSFQRGNEEPENNLKLSKGEESTFIWSVFYTLLDQVVETLNIAEADQRDTDPFNALQYIFIDDPVSSLDENHLIELAVSIASVIKRSRSDLRFILTTHNPLFYNVLHHELGRKTKKHLLRKNEDGSYALEPQKTDSPFAYPLFLKAELEKALEKEQIHKYHFNFLRNILEKTATFLGYQDWTKLLPQTSDGKTDAYARRILNWGSHSKHAGDEVRNLDQEDLRVLRFLVNNINEKGRFHFHQKEEPEPQKTKNAR